MLCCVMLYYVMLRYVMLYFITLHYASLHDVILYYVYILLILIYRNWSEGQVQFRSYWRGSNVSYGSHVKMILKRMISFLLKYLSEFLLYWFCCLIVITIIIIVSFYILLWLITRLFITLSHFMFWYITLHHTTPYITFNYLNTHIHHLILNIFYSDETGQNQNDGNLRFHKKRSSSDFLSELIYKDQKNSKNKKETKAESRKLYNENFPETRFRYKFSFYKTSFFFRLFFYSLNGLLILFSFYFLDLFLYSHSFRGVCNHVHKSYTI